MSDSSREHRRSGHDGGYRAVMTNRNFRVLWFSALFSLIGSAISQVALPILVYDLTESASAMSIIFMIQLVPRAVLSPFAGVLADTFNRQQLMMAASGIQAAGVALLPFSTETWHVAAIAAFISLGAVMFNPAEMATVPTIVEADQLVTALSAVQVASGLTRVIGPAIGAGLIAVQGTDLAFWTQSLLFVIAMATLTRLHLPPMTAIRAFRSAVDFLRYLSAEAMEGLRVVWRVPVVRAVCATEGLWSLALANLSITTVVYVKEELDLGDRSNLVFGLLAVSISAGAVAGALVARPIERRGGRLTLMLVGYLAPLLFVPTILNPPLVVLFACWFLLGFADAWLVIAMFAYVIESVPPNMRGRVFAIWGGVISIASLGTFALVGWLTESIGPQATFMVTGLMVAIGSPLVLWLSGALASIREIPHRAPLTGASTADP
jgi:MFS transporter, NRE family, putaive nickel resistance protein